MFIMADCQCRKGMQNIKAIRLGKFWHLVSDFAVTASPLAPLAAVVDKIPQDIRRQMFKNIINMTGPWKVHFVHRHFHIQLSSSFHSENRLTSLFLLPLYWKLQPMGAQCAIVYTYIQCCSWKLKMYSQTNLSNLPIYVIVPECTV